MNSDLGLVDALVQLSFLVQNTLAEIAGQHDLSIIQTRLLGVLRDREPTMNALGWHLGLDKSSISGLVDRAERRGLVTRTVSETDRRAFQVSITEAGRQLVDQVAARFTERAEVFAAGMSEADRQLLSQLASRIVAAPVDVRDEGVTTTRRRAEMFVERDSRPHVRGTGDERIMLMEFLRSQRATVELKCVGMADAQLSHRSVAPSTLSLLGLVRHLADVERRWFRRVLDGQQVPALFSTANPDEDFDGAVSDPVVVAQAWEAWRAEVAFADRFVAEASDLDVVGEDGWRGTVSLRWVLIHMIEEYARHNGHADLLRERIDGARGL